MIKEKLNNLPYAGTEERYEKWEKEPVPVINAVEFTAKEEELKLPKPLQEINGSELTPKQAIDIDNRALRKPDCPSVVFGRPHGGEYVPKRLLERTSREAYKTIAVIDRGTAEIFRSEKIPSAGTKISRLIVDPNRSPLLEMDLKGSKALQKVLWYKGFYNEKMYKEDQAPAKEEVDDLVERFYLPYYNSMMGLIGSLTDRKKSSDERVLVIDGHSFPTSKNFQFVWDHYGIKDARGLPMFIIGDRDGESCDKDIRETFVQALEKNFKSLDKEIQEFLLRNSTSKEIVGVNEYMKGVHNVQFFGQRSEGVNSIQLELNEDMYVDEKDGDYYNASYIGENMAIIKELLEKTCLDIDSILKNKSNN